ncbi:unnamed protein product [Acanthoscelides obtectus]|uniref:Elongation of very long chain fatty acids protein n=1 Tax=Acanthoscelides obtectus TaxID=200917 RepID=A0A9P0PUM8_ACAOB|nr:unnamed protein product [Acanthoscelides obtectus]CAK1656537.1 Elongation of very long chain fatty acids protein 1 [Acanthoscelides obtectus]
MSLILRKLCHYTWNWTSLGDSRIHELWILGKPVQIVAITTTYLYFVLKLGPQLMKNRKAFDIKMLMMVYNVLQIVLNAYIVYGCYSLLTESWVSWKCFPMEYSNSLHSRKALDLGQIFFLLKVFDLFDTVFFILRKSYRQVTFLHLYHHTCMLVGIWGGIQFVCGGESLWIGLVNATVHTIMFTYYFFAAYDPRWKDNLTAKKILTQLQLVQFLFFFLKFSYSFIQMDCDYPKIISYLFATQNLFMFCLFLDFYYKAYIRQKKNKE